MFHLRLLGSPELTDVDGTTPPGLGPGKPLAVLCYLAREGEARRDAVAAMLWGDADEDRARNAFRQALHRLRGALGNDVVEADRERVALREDADLWVDAEAFEVALAEGDHATALELWRGDFLEGFDSGEPLFQHWVDGQQARFRARYQDALTRATRHALDAGEAEQAVELATRLAAVVPLDPGAALLESRALAAAGRVVEAGAALRAFQDRYRDTMEEEPPQEVAEALDRVREAGAREPPEPGPRARRNEGAGFVREQELGRLLAAWREARDGDGRTVLLEGEPGAGKTRLVDEFLRRLDALDAAVVLRGAERVAGQGVPYESVAEALRGVLGSRGLAGASSHLLAEAARLLPELRDRFDLPTAVDVEDEAGRLRFFEGVAAILDAVAYEEPLCVILERFHNADAATRDLVFFLSNRLRSSPVLFLVSFRATAEAVGIATRYGDEGHRGDTVQVLRLAPLGEEQVRTVLAASREAGELTPEDRDRVARLAGGNPLAAMTLARAVLAGEDIRRAPVPLRLLVRTRLDAARPDERRLLLALALLGRPAPLRLLAACTHLPERGALDAYHGLLGLGLVTETPDGGVAPREAAADAILEHGGAAGASLIAGWTADALEAEGGASAAELARLYRMAGREADACARALEAARRAAGLGAWDAAVTLLELAEATAPSAALRAEATERLAALGRGAARLGPGTAPGVSSAAAPPTRTGVHASGWWRRPVVTGVVVTILAMSLFAALPALRRPGPMATAGRVLRDTLVLVRTEPDGREALLGVTGELGPNIPAAMPLAAAPRPAWLDSLVQLGRAVIAPDGRLVAIYREEGGGIDVVTTLERAAVQRVAGADVRPLGWAPDGSALLVARGRRLADGGYDTDLWIEWVQEQRGATAVDTATSRAVVDAAWAPNGVRLAWSARDRASGQQDVYVANADGTEMWNASADPGEDHDPAWAPDGRRVAFTSDRSGGSDIYAVEVETRRLWRLTWDPALDDRASFSPTGDFVAFESTRDAESAVYVMASYGGEPRRVSEAGQRVRQDGWRGPAAPHLAYLRFGLPQVTPGDTAWLDVQPVYTDYVTRNRGTIRWLPLDDHVLVPSSLPDDQDAGAARIAVIGARQGIGEVVVTAGGWRSDTAMVKVGRDPTTVLSDGFDRPILERWSVDGAGAAPTAGGGRRGTAGMILDGAEATSMTSRTTFPLVYGVRISLWFKGAGPGAARDGEVALHLLGSGYGGVPAVLASVTVDDRTGRLFFAVGREETSQPARFPEDGPHAWHELEILAEPGGYVTFRLDGEDRHRSQVTVAGPSVAANRARLRIVTRGLEAPAILDDISVVVGYNKSLP